MALTRPLPPLDYSQALQMGIASYRRPGDPTVAALLDPHAERYAVRVYTLGLQDVLDGLGLAAAHPAAWRFLAAGQAFAPYSADVRGALPGVKPRMVSLSRGPQVAAALRYIQNLDALSTVQGANYELRQLSIPAMLFEGFWLKPLDSGADYVVPFNALSGEFNLMAALTTDVFFATAKDVAAGFKAFDD
jgi:hypothetical protein